MRNMGNPSGRWFRAWVNEHETAGGWAGPATIKALAPKAVELYDAGATPRAAGIATASYYTLNRRINELEELAADLADKPTRGIYGL